MKDRHEALVSRDLDVADMKPCGCCGGQLNGPGGRNLNAYRITIDSLLIDPRAVQGFVGLSAIVGSQGIARALSPDTKLLKCFGSDSVLMCFECFSTWSVAAVIEVAGRREEQS